MLVFDISFLRIDCQTKIFCRYQEADCDSLNRGNRTHEFLTYLSVFAQAHWRLGKGGIFLKLNPALCLFEIFRSKHKKQMWKNARTKALPSSVCILQWTSQTWLNFQHQFLKFILTRRESVDKRKRVVKLQNKLSQVELP